MELPTSQNQMSLVHRLLQQSLRQETELSEFLHAVYAGSAEPPILKDTSVVEGSDGGFVEC